LRFRTVEDQLERTQAKRVKTADDKDLVRELADELGGLALGLEQAGAYIAKQHISFARYTLITSRPENPWAI
jgi:hypothetical protein